MTCLATVDPKQIVFNAIEEHSPKPTDLLQILAAQLSYTEIQQAVSDLLEAGTVELGSDRRLRPMQSAAAD